MHNGIHVPGDIYRLSYIVQNRGRLLQSANVTKQKGVLVKIHSQNLRD